MMDEDGALFEDVFEGVMVTFGEPDEVLGAVVLVLAVEMVTFEGFALFVSRSRTMKSGTDEDVYISVAIVLAETQILVCCSFGILVVTFCLGQFLAFGIVDVFSVAGTENGFALGEFRSRALFDNRYVHKHRIFSAATLLQLKSGCKGRGFI